MKGYLLVHLPMFGRSITSRHSFVKVKQIRSFLLFLFPSCTLIVRVAAVANGYTCYNYYYFLTVERMETDVNQDIQDYWNEVKHHNGTEEINDEDISSRSCDGESVLNLECPKPSVPKDFSAKPGKR